MYYASSKPEKIWGQSLIFKKNALTPVFFSNLPHPETY